MLMNLSIDSVTYLISSRQVLYNVHVYCGLVFRLITAAAAAKCWHLCCCGARIASRAMCQHCFSSAVDTASGTQYAEICEADKLCGQGCRWYRRLPPRNYRDDTVGDMPQVKLNCLAVLACRYVLYGLVVDRCFSPTLDSPLHILTVKAQIG